MAIYRTSEYQNKKDFAAAMTACTHLDRLCVNGQALSGDWSAERTARGENTMMDLYARAATLLAQPDFEMFRKLSGRFVADAAQKAESDKKSGKISYYGFWQTVDGVDYYLFKNLGNAAKFEQLWIWADALSAAVTLSDGAAEEELDEEQDAEETDEIEEIEEPKPWEQPVTGRNLSFVQKDGKTVLYDNDSKEFVTVTDESGEEHILEMTEYEPIRAPEHTKRDNEKQEDVTVEGELLGYRYRTKADGKWGFISRCFSQILPPQFGNIVVQHGNFFNSLEENEKDYHLIVGKICLDEDVRKNYADICFTTPRETTAGTHKYDMVMLSAREIAMSWYSLAHKEDKELDFSGFFRNCEKEEHLNQWIMWFEGVVYEGSCFSIDFAERKIYYARKPDSFGYKISLSETSKGLNSGYEYVRKRWSFSNGLIREFTKNTYTPLPFGWEDSEHIGCVMERLESDMTVWYSEIRRLTDRYYIDRRDGYWAIIYNDGTLLTPYAFTSITYEWTNLKCFKCFILERFGKFGAGVISGDKDDKKLRYTVSPEYEKVTFNGKCFTVRRMGFVGEIGLDGEWVTPLHREEK